MAFDELAIKIKRDGSVTIEECLEGTISFKQISPGSLISCISLSLVRGGVKSGMLPRNCISFAVNDDGSREACLLHPENKADVTFLGTEYRNFPLPRIAFGFRVDSDGRVTSSKVGIIEAEGRPKPCTKMYRWPLSNVTGTGICLGNNVLPACTDIRTLESIPYLILSMPNNLDGFSPANNKQGLGMRELLELLKGKCQSHYYDKILIPSSMTLGNFISQAPN